jgi:phosphatidylglycerol---prolipoprotein diacylglyceryl transferase
MYPILLKIGSVVIHTYGALVALGFLAGIILAVKRAKKENISEDIVLDLSLYLLIAAILGARLFEVLVNFNEYQHNLWRIFKIWEGGLTYYGGLITAVIVGIIFLKKRKLPIWKIGDLVAPSIALGQAIGRLGCFFAGCCYGKTSNLPWAVIFRDQDCLAPTGIPLHPTQLYSSAGDFIIFLILMGLSKRKKFDGQIFWLYIIFYSIFRFVVEFFRDDPRGPLMFNILTVSQLLGVILFIIGISMYNIRKPKMKN